MDDDKIDPNGPYEKIGSPGNHHYHHRYPPGPVPEPMVENIVNHVLPERGHDQRRKQYQRRRHGHFRETVVNGGTLHRNFERNLQRLRRQIEREERGGPVAGDHHQERERRPNKLPRAFIGRSPHRQGSENPRPNPNPTLRGQTPRDPLSPNFVSMPNDTDRAFTSIGDKLRTSPPGDRRSGMASRPFSRMQSLSNGDTHL